MSGVFEGWRPGATASGDGSIAATGSIGLAQAGDNSTATLVGTAVTLTPEALALAMALPAQVPRTVNLPDRAGGLFVGRERELRLLDEAFEQAGGVVVHAVHGLGGIGKSTLAAHWAGRRAADFNPVWWITAESRPDLDAGLAELARALHPTLVGTLAEEALREATLQWLSAHEGWLLILDNVSDPADVDWLLDRTPNGRFLITTRHSGAGWRGMAGLLDLDLLELPEAVRLFTRIYDGPSDGVEELCAELGRLPLAVDQAAAYCREAEITPRTYLEWLAAYPGRLFAATTEGGDTERTVARVWRMTLDRLADTPLAERILRIMAWWAPEGIPRELLADLADPPAVTDALRRLSAHSMIRVRGDVISVHRLVQAVARTSEGAAGGVEEARRTAGELLDRAMTRAQTSRDGMRLGRVCADHAEVLAAHVGDDSEEVDVSRLFAMASAFLGATTAFGRALALGERAVALVARKYGPDHVHRLAASRALASVCENAGERDRAVAEYMRLAVDCERVLGPDHPSTIQARLRLCCAALNRPDPPRATLRALGEQLELAVRVLGPGHPVVLEALVPVFTLFRVSAEVRPEEDGAMAVETIEVALAGTAERLTPGDETLAHMKWELAAARMAVGDVAGAVAVAQELVDELRQRWGDADTRTFTARVNLVNVLMSARETDRARQLASVLLADSERLLDDSPSTRAVRKRLSAVLARTTGPDVTRVTEEGF
ncbi:tetratricopeptide repeat protein [Streptomyces sp. HD]|uniref:tetratricopeptide repeat protein n=1 Tax=Streptomyces sp. HD TaxID=3020892 RepID=UPI002330DFBB|nr:tetratricopeptide repeat protein [Streptomyces sp. HD]MDC0767495.1 tetratricopeptide repeat protein [Streptomyces sp. HD]